MAVAEMAKGKKDRVETPPDDAMSSFKVRRKAGQVVAKITTLRGLKSIAELFEQSDVEDFFNHLLLHELQREASSLTGRKT